MLCLRHLSLRPPPSLIKHLSQAHQLPMSLMLNKLSSLSSKICFQPGDNLLRGCEAIRVINWDEFLFFFFRHGSRKL